MWKMVSTKLQRYWHIYTKYDEYDKTHVWQENAEYTACSSRDGAWLILVLMSRRTREYEVEKLTGSWRQLRNQERHCVCVCVCVCRRNAAASVIGRGMRHGWDRR